ncbi:MAG: class I adenylate-forming enzyme family protein, partial [Dehalococcoidia bacterium]
MNAVQHLGELIAVSGVRFGSRTAVVSPDRAVSFAELDELASAMARNLLAEGIGPGDVVTLWFENGWRWLAAYYGVLRAGAVVNPVNALLTAAEVDYIVRDCGARLIVGAVDRVHQLAPAPGVRIVDDASGLDALLAPAADTERLPPGDIGLSSLASICYTSGTTGRPKGAVLTHQAVLMNTLMTSLMHGRSAGDVVVSALPCPHVYGNVVMNSAIACGLTLVLFPRFDEETVIDSIARHRATMFEGVPTMYMRLLNHAALARADLSSLRRCTVGGQTMPVATMEEVERRFGCRLLELWGMTELAGLGTTHPWNGPRRLGSIGVPMPFYEARVAHVDDASRTMPDGDVGELLIRGPSVMNGYLNHEAATREAIEPDGWLHTGDLA